MTDTCFAPTFPGLGSVWARVRSTNRGVEMPTPTCKGTIGINKQSVDLLGVPAPAPGCGDGSGMSGDFVGDTKRHGGADKTVYTFAK